MAQLLVPLVVLVVVPVLVPVLVVLPVLVPVLLVLVHVLAPVHLLAALFGTHGPRPALRRPAPPKALCKCQRASAPLVQVERRGRLLPHAPYQAEHGAPCRASCTPPQGAS